HTRSTRDWSSDVCSSDLYLPRTKHLHIVTTLFNVGFRKQTPRGQLSLIKDIENQESFGAATIRDFSWKQLLDGYTCTECGRCSEIGRASCRERAAIARDG